MRSCKEDKSWSLLTYLYLRWPRLGQRRHSHMRASYCGHDSLGSQHAEVPSPDVSTFTDFAAQAKLSLPGLRAPEHPLFTYTPPLLVMR